MDVILWKVVLIINGFIEESKRNEVGEKVCLDLGNFSRSIGYLILPCRSETIDLTGTWIYTNQLLAIIIPYVNIN